MKNLLRLIVVIVGVLVVITVARNLMVPKASLHLLIWENYLADDTVSNFEDEFDTNVSIDTYNSNEELLDMLQENPGYYDVAVPSDYMVEILRKQNLLTQIDPSVIPNLQYIHSATRNHYYDPDGTHSVPYAFGSTGFGINTEHVPDETITWKTLSDPRFNDKIIVMNDMRYVLGSALLELGLNPNTQKKADLDRAVALLKGVLPNVQQISTESQIELMVSNDAWVTYDYSGDVYQMQEYNTRITYVLPEAGSMQFYDAMVVPINAPHRELAMQFINYIHRPQVSAAITNTTHYPTPNTAALPFVDEALRTNPSVFPAQATMSKLHFVRDVGADITLYEAAWNEVLEAFGAAEGQMTNQ